MNIGQYVVIVSTSYQQRNWILKKQLMKKNHIISTILLSLALSLALSIGFSPTGSAADKTVRKTYRGRNYTIEVSYPRFQKEKKLSNEIKKIINQEIKTFKKGVPKNEGKNNKENEIPKSYLNINFEIFEQNKNLMSMALYVGAYDEGAAHPNTWTISINYDKKRKKIMQLQDIFIPESDFIKKISEKSIEKLKNEENLKENEEWLTEGAGPDGKNFSIFNLTENAFVLTFDPYKVAPYSQGNFRAEIPLMELYKILRPEFLIHQIKKEVSKIEKNLKSYKKKTKDLWKSTEGGTLEGYFEQGKIKKIQAEYFGETRKNLQKYYFFDEILIYYEEKNTVHNKSISALAEGEKLKSRTKTKKYYFLFEQSVLDEAKKLLENL